MTQPCPGYPPGESLNPPAHDGGYCCWACDHDWDDADCTCFEEPAAVGRGFLDGWRGRGGPPRDEGGS